MPLPPLTAVLSEQQAQLVAPLLVPGTRIAWDTFQSALGVESYRALGVMLALERNGFGSLWLETSVDAGQGDRRHLGRFPFADGLPAPAVTWLREAPGRTDEQVYHVVEFEVAGG